MDKTESRIWWWVLVFILSAILGAILALPNAIRAQEVTDTAYLTITGNLTEVVIVRDFVTTPSIGDTIIFSAQAVDEEGDPIAADFTWVSGDTTALQLIQQPDGTAMGIALRKATVWIAVRAEPITEVRTAFFRGGELHWMGRTAAQLGIDGTLTIYGLEQSVQLCGYLVRGNFLVGESPGPPVCPTVFLPEPIPTGQEPVFAPVRRKPWSAFTRIAQVDM